MRWISVTVFLVNFPLLQVAGQCGYNNRICPDSCHCPGTSNCPENVTRRCGTGKCAQPWSGPTCRRISNRIKGFRVEVSNGTTFANREICYTDTSTEVKLIYEINCTRPMVGRYVYITRPGKVALNIHEFEVYGCENYWFGYQCDRKCNCANSSEVCDKAMGSCRLGGCRPGYTGPDCYIVCPNGSFGAGCNGICHCLHANGCSKMDGSCTGGCASGYKGLACQTVCPNGSFGAGCNGICHCLRADGCSKMDGSCTGGCAPGYKGLACQTACPNWSFGAGCNGICHCLRADGCNKMDGSCAGGCAPGYKGNACQTACPNWSFGAGCNGICHCLRADGCNKMDGSCAGGCAPGYKGNACQTAWLFGAGCNRICHCLRADGCNKMDGSCAGGCAPGYKGNACQTACPNGLFGTGCNGICHCLRADGCSKMDGSCTGGCAPGYKGPACQTACHNGSFGAGCHGTCHCLRADGCSKMDGSCIGGCTPGYEGHACQTACPSGSFGAGCNGTCHCLRADGCSATDGSCTGGCATGYNGLACETECIAGYFGYDCNSTCRCFDHNEACHRATGRCESGCTAGYTGIDCQQECNSGQYGQGCQFSCHCSNGSRCDNVNATCPGGCSDGYMGEACQTLAHTVVPEEVAVIGPVVGGIVGLCVLVALVIAVIIKSRRRRSKGSDTPDGTAMREGLDAQCVDPENGHDTGGTDFVDDGVAYVNAQSLQTPGTRVSLRDLTAYVAQRLKRRKPFENEFLNLPQGLLEPCEEAQKPANVQKCRYKGMLPYDHTRVVLDVINNDPYSDFINANYIQGYSQKKAYVASQGTTSQNMEEFWRMVWTIHAGQIVMLSGLVERGKIKVERYWPDEHAKKSYGDILVETMDIQNMSDCCIRTFKVQRAVNVRTVKQFQYLAWPDHGVPSDTSGILVLRDRVKFASDTHDGPVIVHCSAGVGRTGTYICFDYLMDKLERENEVDIFQCVSDLRHQRTQMVQTPEQYAFLHMLVNDGVLCRDSKFTTDDFLSLDMNSDGFQERNHHQYERMQKFVHLPTRNRTTSTLGSPGQDEGLDQEYLPRTANRVWLSTTANGKNDSINAVYVPITKDGHELIATQSPTADNVADFWRMVYERKCTTIAMLSMEPKGSVVYWPSDSTPIRHGPFEISLLEAAESGYFVHRKLSCVHFNKKNESPQVVRHICLTDLDDDLDIPSGESILEMKELIEDWHRQIEPGHVVIHCRNGSDQTGLICVALEILERIQTEQWVNMMVAVKRVRTACPKAVISLEQYRFCYNLVKTYLDRFNTYANFA